MKKFELAGVIATGIGMMCAMFAGNTNTLLANGFLMVTIALVATRD